MLRRIAISVLGALPNGFEVATSTRGSEGFARAFSGGVRLIFVDDHLPDMSGIELCKRLLADRLTDSLPIVILLKRGTPTPPLDDLPPNVVATLHKPFTPESLAAVASRACERGPGPVNFARLRARLQPAVAPPPPSGRKTQLVVAKSPSLVGRAPVRAGARLTARAMAKVTDFSGKRVGVPAGSQPPRSSFRMELHAAAGNKSSGVLRILTPLRAPLEMYLDAGRIVVVATRDAAAYGESAAEALPGKVLPASLHNALAEQAESSVPFLLTLGSRGLLPKAAAISLMHQFNKQYVARICAHRGTLRFEYKALEALPGFTLRIEPETLSIDQWILEMTRYSRIDDLDATIRHEGLVGVPAYRSGGEAILEKLKLTEPEREFAARVNARNNLGAIARTLEISGEAAFVLIHQFRCLDVMDYRVAPGTFVVTPRTSVRRVLPLRR